MKLSRSLFLISSALLSLLASGKAAGFESDVYGYLSVTQITRSPSARFSAMSTSNNATIRDLRVETSHSDVIPDIGVYLPWGLEATYRKYDQAAVHSIRGVAATTNCIRIAFKTFCAALQNSLDGVIRWEIEHQQFTLNKRLVESEIWNLRYGLGVDLMRAKAHVVAGTYNASESGTVPLPYLLTKAGYKLSDRYKISTSFRYIKLSRRETSIKYLDSELLLTRRLGDVLEVGLGYQYQLSQTEYTEPSEFASLKSILKSPFIRFTLGY